MYLELRGEGQTILFLRLICICNRQVAFLLVMSISDDLMITKVSLNHKDRMKCN